MNSFISRIGGKRQLRSKIVERFPSEGVARYVEVFGGAGWVLFYKPQYAPEEIFNDLDSELINLFRVVKYHEGELSRQLDGMLISRELFQEERSKQGCIGWTDIQRAARYFYLIKASFGSDIRSFGCRPKNLSAAVDFLKEARIRLQRVMIEHKDCCELIKQYDSLGTLFYCDPPYFGTEKYYVEQFSETDHIRLRDCLAGIKGRFVLSYNDCDFIRELYQGFTVETLSRQNNLKPGTIYREMLIRNY